MSKRIAIVQSNYIPWKGYFDLIASVDEFVLLDDVQYTSRDWRNRNQIKTPNGLQWLSIPVDTKHKRDQLICEAKTTNNDWRQEHWMAIQTNYAKARHFKSHEPLVRKLYMDSTEQQLSAINRSFIEEICTLLSISTKLIWSTDVPHQGIKTDRLLSICQALNATSYLSGPAAKDYIESSKFQEAGVELQFFDYDGYPEYTQLHGDFEHRVSVIDLILNEGPNAHSFLKAKK